MNTTQAPKRTAQTQPPPAPVGVSSSVRPGTAGDPAQPPAEPCTFEQNSDGSGYAMVYIAPDILKRLKSRAGNNQPLNEYLWFNIFKRALETHVY